MTTLILPAKSVRFELVRVMEASILLTVHYMDAEGRAVLSLTKSQVLVDGQSLTIPVAPEFTINIGDATAIYGTAGGETP